MLNAGLANMNGFEVRRRLRQFSDIPVIFLTARSDEIDRVVGLKISADDYVTKPFSTRELAARIRVILRGGSSVTAVNVNSQRQIKAGELSRGAAPIGKGVVSAVDTEID